ncbi:STM3941 family protein [Pandoraea pneumonica]|uniref:STM3941 family protein n=1 Tax=Pandoraea pneumonica TaxID=2508299 RepID=UPI003CEB10E6
MTSLTVGPSKRKAFFLLLASIAFVIAGGFMVTEGGSRRMSEEMTKLVGWASIVFFGAGIPIALRRLFDGQPRLQIDSNGILDGTLGVGLIPWSDITGAHIKSMFGNAFVCLEVKAPEKWLEKMSSHKRKFAAANVKLGYTALVLNVSDLSEDPKQIEALILKNLATWQDTRSQFVGWTG